MSKKLNPEVCDPSSGCCSPNKVTTTVIEGSIDVISIKYSDKDGHIRSG